MTHPFPGMNLYNLDALLNQVYERAGYGVAIDYQRQPVPPLMETEAAWVAEVLQGHS